MVQWYSTPTVGIVSLPSQNKGHIFRSDLLAMFLVQCHYFLAILALPQIVVTQHHSECAIQAHGPLNQEWVYTAPARFVPVLPVDASLQAGFIRLFTNNDNYTKVAIAQEPLPPGISQDDLDFIASVCPRTAFFYSMSPQHVVAREMLQRYLAALPSPREVLRVAGVLLHSSLGINPKIWYYALVGAAMERPDMAGIMIAQPLDAMPDLFVPAPILGEALSRYRPVFGVGDTYLSYGGGGGGGGGSRRVRGHRGGGGFVPSHGPPGPPISHPGIRGLAPLGDFESGSYQTFSASLGSASNVHEHRVKFAAVNSTVVRDDDVEQTKPVQDATQSGFTKRRGQILRKRSNKKRRNHRNRASSRERRDGRKQAEKHHNSMEDDNAGAESIASEQFVSFALPPDSSEEVKRTGAGVRRSMMKRVERVDKHSSRFNNGTSGRRVRNKKQHSAEDSRIRLSYGEEDDEFDELMRIHKTSSNSTRDIRRRILLRRQRRKKTDQPTKLPNKVKRQAFGTPLFQQPYQGIDNCIVINGTIGVENGVENKLWYFREDLMVNQFHWYWHQAHPVNATRHQDRRSELFSFVHHNIVARYNAERLSNGLPRTLELLLRNGAILEEGYNSLLIDIASGKYWTPREPHIALTDILHEEDPDFARNIFLKELEDLYHKLVFSIKDGHLLGPDLQPVPITNFHGIDLLGNTVEASDISVNPLYYDSIGIHNLGHQVLGLSQDPQYISQVPTGVMADTITTMRDPIFYTFHSGIDNIFDRHKRTLVPYQLYDGEFPLVWPGVAISNVEVVSSFGGHPNLLKTFFSSNRFPLESGIDNSIHNGEVREDICAVHLNHEPFTYKITVDVNPCVHTRSGKGTVRIFMAPRYNEYGQRFTLKVQRRLMFQLDVFPVQLQQGRNVILRHSVDNSLTKPWSPSLRQQAFGGRSARQQSGAADYCGCGWPLHLLIPKGNHQGMPYDLFVMITNFDEDIVHNNHEDLSAPEGCTSPYLFCGIPFRQYPDARPMGYPFDRLPYKVPARCSDTTGYPEVVCKMLGSQLLRPPKTLEEYVHPVPNMASRVVVIQHTEALVA